MGFWAVKSLLLGSLESGPLGGRLCTSVLC